MESERAHDVLERELLTWEGVESRPHRFGGREYRLGRREIGHVHGDELIDIPLPRRLHDEVIAAGRADPHHVLPDSGWISVRLRVADDVRNGIELLRLSYELALEQNRKKGTTGRASDESRGIEAG
jgi:Family of unknown function (DUF5519)